jgi:hypothetical protein
MEMLLKEELVKQLFEVRVNKDVDPVEHKVVVIETMLAMNASKLANKLKDKVEKDDVYAQYMCSAWEAIQNFIPNEDTTWEAILDKSDLVNRRRLMKSIILRAQGDIAMLSNNDFGVKREVSKETGFTERKIYVVNTESLDVERRNENGEYTHSLVDEVTESLWSTVNEYAASPFVTWFKANKSTFLTRKQNDLVDALLTMDCFKETGYFTDDITAITGQSKAKIYEMLQRIYERTMKAWYKENPTGSAKTFREESIEMELAALTPFMELVNDDSDLGGQNERLSDWLKIHAKEIYKETKKNEWVKDFYVNELVYTGLKGKQLMTFVKWLHSEETELKGSILYAISSLFERRIEWLKERYEATQLERHQRLVFTQRDYAKIERNKAIKERYALLKNPPCKVYKLDELTGEEVYVRTIFTGFSFSNTKIYTVDAYGNTVSIIDNPEKVNTSSVKGCYDVFSVDIQTGKKTIHSQVKYEKLYEKGV